MPNKPSPAKHFGPDFIWGAASAAFQTEGACYTNGKGESIWDKFIQKSRKVKNRKIAAQATNFYNFFDSDLTLLKEMNFNSFRFSLAWPRILPNGIGKPNQKGIDFYKRVIDDCYKKNITPWVTLYHWDLPQVLEEKGGWTNRNCIDWFSEYTMVSSQAFSDQIKNWMVLNEPLAFTALGYLLGKHAPGRKGLRNFLPALHHAGLAQAAGGRILRSEVKDANIGTTFSCSQVKPFRKNLRDRLAAEKLDAVLNRICIEPSLGLGYPIENLTILRRIEKYFQPGDMENIKFNFDFIGLQYYFRIVVAHSWLPPFHMREISARKRNKKVSEMEFEIYEKGISKLLTKFSSYPGVKQIIITESGVCYPDIVNKNGEIQDTDRIKFFQKTLKQIKKSKAKGIPVDGYFVWSLTDNFEWAEGIKPRFGLVYIDYVTQTRMMKQSGKWFQNFLADVEKKSNKS